MLRLTQCHWTETEWLPHTSQKVSPYTFIEHLLCAGSVLGAEDSEVNKRVVVPILMV